MGRGTLRALLAGSLAAAGCATDGTPPAQPGETFVPRTVQQFSADAASRGRQPSGHARSTPIADDGWRPSRDADQDIVLVGQSIEVPPAPAAEDDGTAQDNENGYDGPAASGRLGEGRPIDLGSALALVAGQNPQVNFARAQVREAYARLNRAELMWVPDLQAGANYHRHEGNLQDVGGAIVDINRSSLNAGLGAGATGAGTVPVPGVVADFHAADAIFGPEIARRSAWASRHAVDAELNDQLLNVALAYLDLIEATSRATVVRQTLANAEELVRITADFARTGQGLQADAERATTELRLRQNELSRAEEDAAVASARLASLVRLDPTQRLAPVEAVALPIDLVDAACEPRDLVAQALGRRPELRQQRALVAEAIERLKREKYAPLMPSVLVGASYSGFGGGLGDTVGSFHDRADFDALAVWEVRNLGWGERAARNEAAARIDQARYRELRTLDEVAREVVEAHAQVTARAPQVAVAEQAIESALRSAELSRQRIRDGQGLPIEALQAIQALDAARREHLRAVTAYNEAQFRLHRALGWPISAM